jgi:hypothetical protein
MLTKFWSENLKGNQLKVLGTDMRIILEWILGKQCEKCGLDSSDSGLGPVVGFWEHCNEPSGSIKGGEFLD